MNQVFLFHTCGLCFSRWLPPPSWISNNCYHLYIKLNQSLPNLMGILRICYRTQLSCRKTHIYQSSSWPLPLSWPSKNCCHFLLWTNSYQIWWECCEFYQKRNCHVENAHLPKFKIGLILIKVVRTPRHSPAVHHSPALLRAAWICSWVAVVDINELMKEHVIRMPQWWASQWLLIAALPTSARFHRRLQIVWDTLPAVRGKTGLS